MNTLDAIRQRRAVKHFDAKHQITPAETDALIDLAMQAPSSFNIQHWRLVNVKDKRVRGSSNWSTKGSRLSVMDCAIWHTCSAVTSCVASCCMVLSQSAYKGNCCWRCHSSTVCKSAMVCFSWAEFKLTWGLIHKNISRLGALL